MDAIASYSGESEGEDYVQPESFKRLTAAINSAPAVDSKRELLSINPVDPATKEIEYNPKYEQLAAPIVGPENPFLTKLQAAAKNTLTGYVERADLNDFQFEAQRRTFHSYGTNHNTTLIHAAIHSTVHSPLIFYIDSLKLLCVQAMLLTHLWMPTTQYNQSLSP
jgi:hypothetical protein